jgi:hypothetical protein
MTNPPSPADARLKIVRTMQSLFLEMFAENDEEGVPLEGRDLEDAQTLVDEIVLELLDVLGLEVVSADSDGSMLVKLTPETD